MSRKFPQHCISYGFGYYTINSTKSWIPKQIFTFFVQFHKCSFYAKWSSLWAVKILLFYFENRSNLKGPYLWNFAYLEGIIYIWNSNTRQMSKIPWVKQITIYTILFMSNTLCQVIYSVLKNIMSTYYDAFTIHSLNWSIDCWYAYCILFLLDSLYPFIIYVFCRLNILYR